MTLAWFIYQLCFILGRNGLQKYSREVCPTENQFFLASLEQGSKGSQPSRLHEYFLMRYNLPNSSNGLKVSFPIDPTLQKYWSLVVYDSYGLPLPAYVNDENVKKTIKSSDGEVGQYDVEVHLLTRPLKSPYSTPQVNEIDLGVLNRGYVLFRLVHPQNHNKAVELSKPVVTKL
eukprot:CAMPEP_0170114966 /NCGR_PEP_ID=MMETSP0020_2-20130122/11117_1 /TAXON_ID=98059 /ORGANISM="Dinobryon sp., Strain UTEXLB2267" /LENGTH=173 /DNA_ID=CAMNT_0010342251 /DNA_START=678 /DNA_END=1199 /DNA_ORIENTATION=+